MKDIVVPLVSVYCGNNLAVVPAVNVEPEANVNALTPYKSGRVIDVAATDTFV